MTKLNYAQQQSVLWKLEHCSINVELQDLLKLETNTITADRYTYGEKDYLRQRVELESVEQLLNLLGYETSLKYENKDGEHEYGLLSMSVTLPSVDLATIHTQAKALADLEAEVKRLRAALEFYADENNLHSVDGNAHMRLIDGGPFWTYDRGLTARQALTPTQEVQE